MVQARGDGLGKGVGGVVRVQMGFGDRADQPDGLARSRGKAPGFGLSGRVGSHSSGRVRSKPLVLSVRDAEWVSALGEADRLGRMLDSGCLGLKLGQRVGGPDH